MVPKIINTSNNKLDVYRHLFIDVFASYRGNLWEIKSLHRCVLYAKDIFEISMFML